jgi:hypothetical protein
MVDTSQVAPLNDKTANDTQKVGIHPMGQSESENQRVELLFKCKDLKNKDSSSTSDP